MKLLLLVLIQALWLTLATAQTTKVIYTCVMHPEVRTDKPGNCPKCSMSLVKKTVKVTTSKKIQQPSGGKAPVQIKAQEQMNMEMPESEHHNEEAILSDTLSAETASSKVNMQPGKTVRYDLYVTDTIVNFTGKHKHAYAVNGSIPAPALVFTEGDTAEIYLHNKLRSEETSLHWHGVILPNQFDGVPYLTTARIGPGETHLYKFAVVQNGTYWYHSHTALQEQAGMYGALIFKKREVSPNPSEGGELSPSPLHGEGRGEVVVLSEWADENPTQTQRRLRTGNDWFSIKKKEHTKL